MNPSLLVAKAVEVFSPGPRDVWEGLLRSCTPPPRRAAVSPGLPRPQHSRTRSLPPAPRPASGAGPRIPTASRFRAAALGCSGPSRHRRQESHRLPVQERASAACAKLGCPKAALGSCRPPSRPRRILRSPCRWAAISDKRLAELAEVRRAGNGRTRTLTSRGARSGGRWRLSGQCPKGRRGLGLRRRVRQGPGRAAAVTAPGIVGKRMRGQASRASGEKGRGLRPVPYKCSSSFRKTYLQSAERMPPTVLERVPTPTASAASRGPSEIQVQI
ncbi:uncharacterized protein LOC115300864 [Suricata suricatta]|uniref:uncharacterized protein LOC115300864 n=1 Tax=Suricata suricatta TaxID=37032 RepID=UPI001155C4F6|nr:uncharacterized protein LOC115300864 [Suricata suricatta]